MDILSARKKAAERARAEKKKEPQAAPAPPVVDAEQKPGPNMPAPAAAPASVEPGPATAEPAAAGEVGASDSGNTDAEEAALPELELLSFRLGDEEYAVRVDSVKEVLKNRELTAVPNAPDYVLGVTALRGPILPVIDLCKRLGLPPGRRDEKSRIIVVNLNDEEAGILVDRVTGVVRVEAEAVRPAPETIEHGAEFLRGIVRKDEKMYILLDIEKAAGA